MAILTAQQRKLFDELHRSRLEDFKTFNKKSYRGIWNSVIEKYPETAHFIYELLQNADDAEATEVYIIVNKHEMIFKHNGKKHFDVTSEDAVPVGDINSITGIGDSSKIETENKIGKFGVGFKAVFQYTDTPEIYDDYFKFKIENYIVPTLLPYDHPERKEGETLFLFPFKDEVKAYNEIIRKLERLDNPILFLRNLQKIVWRIDRKKGVVGDELIYSKTLIDEEEYGDNTYMEKYLLQDSSGSRSFFLFSENIEISSENKILPICVGFYYNETEKKLITNTQQNIFCFFPTKETFKTCFISHGPFLLTDNRQNLKPDEQYNKTLINYIAELAARAVLYLRDYGIKHKHPLIDENLSEIIPEYKYSHSWYGNSLDDLFEYPIYYAFKEIVETEEIFLTRNNKYLKIEDAYVAAPRELEGLLNQKQLSSLIVYSEEDEDKRNADFMKWELSQKISKRDDDIFEERNEFSSEQFGSCISEDFMKEQDFRWVIRLYNFLRSAAPKLWKILDRDKNAPQSRLVFRSAPIIKTQKGGWVAPYLDNTTLNVYLPLKKDVSSEYNFVSEEYLENKSAIRFFNELNIKEPDELDYIQSVILNKFRGEEFEIDDDDIRTDFDVIVAYYKNLHDVQKRQSFLELIKLKLYLLGADGILHRPSEMYISSPMLEDYFTDVDVVFVDIDFYDSAISKYGLDNVTDFVTLLGVDRYPVVLKENRYSKYQVSSPSRELIQTQNYSHYTIEDYVLHGFSEAIDDIEEDLSLYIWNEVLPGINYEKYENLCLSFRRKYARTYEKAYYDSSFKCDLINKAWIYTNNGDLLSPKEMFLEDLAPEYNRNNGLITFLGIQKRERPVIIEMGGTEEQQNSYDFGKSIKDEFGEDLSEDEIRMALLKARAEKKSRQRKESIQEVESGQVEMPTQSINQELEDESVESKLNKKWEKKATEKIARPHSSPNTRSEVPIDFNSSRQEEQPIQPFFENKPSSKSHDSTEIDNDSVQKKMKAREEEAKEKAERTSELVQILELLNNEKKFSFKWYKLLMELMHANRSENMNRHVQIDFSEWSFICSDKLLHLTIPSKPVPQWVAEAEKYVITSLGKEPKIIEGVIVKTDETSIDVSIEKDKDLEEICAKANSIRLSADNSSNFIDESTLKSHLARLH